MKRLFMILFMGIVIVSGCSHTDGSDKIGNLDGRDNSSNEINNNRDNENDLDVSKGFDATVDGVISPEAYQLSEESFAIDSTKEVLHVISTWSPSGARVIFGFINAKTDEEFWEAPQKSGSWIGDITTSHLKAGEYYIAIKTEPEINDYDKRERTIVAHFQWK